jgi:protein-S-isoprenylcysteine O-methyltransferase Ste14
MNENNPQQDTSGIRFPPPFYYLIGLLVGFGIHLLFPVKLAKPSHRLIVDVLGGSWILLGLLLFIWAQIAFRRAGTSPIPHVPTAALTPDGPYSVTRNPMYLSMAMFCVGISLVANMLWPLLSVPVAIFIIDRIVVPKEERYLEAKFGDEYRQYKARVRRWV